MTEEFTLAIGTKTACMVRENTLGRMADVTKESIIWTKRMVTVFTFGPTAENTKELGLWANNMEKASTINLANCLKVEFGSMENVSLGNRWISIFEKTLYDLFFT